MTSRIAAGLVVAIATLLVQRATAASEAALAAAVKNQDVAAIDRLLEQKADVNAAQPDGATALHWAAYRNLTGTVDRLLDAGAHANVANAYGITPLSLACTNNNAAMVARLLSAGGNPNSAASTGETPLMTCAYTGNVEAVRLLLARGARVDGKERIKGQTALMWAAAEGHGEVVKLLAAAGADVHARSTVTRHLVCFLVQCGRDAATEYMERGAYTALLQASRRGDIGSVQVLLDAGANIEEVAADRYSPLLLASHSDHLALTRYLLQRGANPNASTLGYTALHTAVLRGNVALVQLLVDAGADLNARITKPAPMERFSYGWMVLPEAVVGATPYLLAAKYVEVEIMRALLSAGADTHAVLNDGTTALMAAAGTGWGIGGSADRRGRTLDAAEISIELDSEARALDAVRLALDAGDDANAANRTGSTALHGAAAHGYQKILQLLVDRGGRVDVKDGTGKTASQLIAQSRR